MSEGMNDPRLSAEGELALARLALDEGDLSHAADHVAGALAHAPTMPEVHELLAQFAALPDGGVPLFPLDDHVFIGTAVARAHLLAAAGQPGEGLELLAAATGHAPGGDWAGVPWVAAPELPGRLEADRLARVLMQVCAGIGDPVPETERAPLLPYLELARNSVAAHPHHGLLLGAASALARRVGEVALAVGWAERGVAELPSKLAEVWLGYAYRSAGRAPEAIAALRRAVDHDPDDLSVYADIAGTLADHGQLDEAIGWVDRALTKDPNFDCAVHTAHRLRYRRDGDLGELVALADFQRDHPDNSHEHHDLAECCHELPWLGHLPAATDAVANILRQALAENLTPDRLTVSALEPPSAMRTVGAVLPAATITVDSIGTPDLRLPRRASGRRLWHYEGSTASPALAVPSDIAAQRIRQLAHPAWPHPPAAYDRAVGLATLEVDDLLGLLVHPPAVPDSDLGQALARHDPGLWVRCVQVWACLGLLHHRTDEPWPDSARRRTLVELVWGVEDWITEAALFALVTAAWVDPTVRADVARIVGERLADGVLTAQTRTVTINWSLAQLALATPELDAETVALAGGLIAAESTPPQPSPTTARPGPLGRLRRWLTRRS